MGISTYAVLVKTEDDVAYWLNVAQRHNNHANYDEIGEPLYPIKLISFVKHCRQVWLQGSYLIFMNGGGGEESFAWIARHRPSPQHIIFAPFDKPNGFTKALKSEDTILWHADTGRDTARLAMHQPAIVAALVNAPAAKQVQPKAHLPTPVKHRGLRVSRSKTGLPIVNIEVAKAPTKRVLRAKKSIVKNESILKK